MKKKYFGKAESLIEKVSSLSQSQRSKLQYQLGVDQAGRGPVFGPMLYAALWWPKKFASDLQALGFNDSKKLKQRDRQQLYQILQQLTKSKILFFATQTLSAQYISNKMLAERGNESLNAISHNSAIKLIRSALQQGFNIKWAFLDTVGDAGKYQDKIRQSIDSPETIVRVSAKADSLFKVVSAASIVAKVTRDRQLKDWKFVQEIETVGELGSGYPSDPTTVEWMRVNMDEVFGYPNLIRFSWATYENNAGMHSKFRFKKHLATIGLDVMNTRFGLASNGPSIFT